MPAAQEQREKRLRKRLMVEFGEAYPLQRSGFTTNISPRGLCISSKFLHHRGASLIVEVRGKDGEVATVRGRVTWANQGTPSLGIPSTMGVELLVTGEDWFRLVADAAHLETGKEAPAPSIRPITPIRPIRPVTTAPLVPEPPKPGAPTRPPAVMRAPPAPPPTPNPATPPPVRPAKPVEPTPPPKAVSKAPPTLEELKAQLRTQRKARYPAKLRVRFGSERPDEFEGQTADVGEEGLALEALTLPAPGAELVLEIDLPDGGTVSATGTVVRTRRFRLLQDDTLNSVAVKLETEDPRWYMFVAELAAKG